MLRYSWKTPIARGKIRVGCRKNKQIQYLPDEEENNARLMHRFGSEQNPNYSSQNIHSVTLV
jgi:hypothetical protein